MTPSRLAISVPLVHAHAHPAVAGPVFASHPQDFQVFPSVSGDRKNEESRFAKNAHVGPPVLNVEVKLIGLDDTSVEGGAKPVGEVRLSFEYPSCASTGISDCPARSVRW